MNASWHHVAISVQDIDRSLEFYRDLLEFELDWDRDHYSGKRISSVVALKDADARVVMLAKYI